MPREPSPHPFHDPILELLEAPLARLAGAFADLPSYSSPLDSAANYTAISSVLDEVAVRMGDNYPYFHPLYAGQMLKPPHPIARAAYALAMSINPNNHARDGGRASSRMEIEAVAQIARMFGWTSGRCLTHLSRTNHTTGCGCGCLAVGRYSGRGSRSG